MNFYSFLADLIAVVHLSYIAFVVSAMAAIIVGGLLGWSWVRNFWFRLIHLLMILLVVVEALCGILCPLTDWEGRLRAASGIEYEPGWFIDRVVHKLLFVDLSPEFLTVCYVIFALLALAVFVLIPPHWARANATQKEPAGR